MQSLVSQSDPVLIEQALEDVLQGQSFRSSRQCQALLRYIVEHTLAGREDLLRERVIGSKVFGRPADYDTANDPVVRSRAGEVRKRLAQHYLHEGDFRGCVRIEIPSGSYQATFEPLKKPNATELITEGSEPESKPLISFASRVVAAASSSSMPSAVKTSRIRVRQRWILGMGGIALAFVLGVWLVRFQQTQDERAYARFWAPISDSSKPTIIYIGANYAYRLSPTFLSDYRIQHHLENNGPEFFIDLKKGDAIDESNLLPTNRLIGFGDVAATARIASTLTRLNKKYDLRYGNDLSITDLRSSPAFLLGGFSNTWALEIMHDSRFTLEQGDRIVDQKNRDKVWIRNSSQDSLKQDDYAVISRLPKSDTGVFVLVISGIDTYGNQAAADYLSDPEQIGLLMKNMPAGWERKNLQIVLHTTIVKQVPAAVNVEAVYSW